MTYTAPAWDFLKNNRGTDTEVIRTELVKIATEIGEFTALASGNIIVGNVSGVAADVALSGDATLANTGAITLASKAVKQAKAIALDKKDKKLKRDSALAALKDAGILEEVIDY